MPLLLFAPGRRGTIMTCVLVSAYDATAWDRGRYRQGIRSILTVSPMQPPPFTVHGQLPLPVREPSALLWQDSGRVLAGQ